MSTLPHTNLDAPREAGDAVELRETMIGALRGMGAVRSDRVAEVFRAVPRHLFTPGAALRQVYTATAAVPVKWDEPGAVISTVSAPELQAFMLEQADIRAGMCALEIGSGSPETFGCAKSTAAQRPQRRSLSRDDPLTEPPARSDVGDGRSADTDCLAHLI